MPEDGQCDEAHGVVTGLVIIVDCLPGRQVGGRRDVVERERVAWTEFRVPPVGRVLGGEVDERDIAGAVSANYVCGAGGEGGRREDGCEGNDPFCRLFLSALPTHCAALHKYITQRGQERRGGGGEYQVATAIAVPILAFVYSSFVAKCVGSSTTANIPSIPFSDTAFSRRVCHTRCLVRVGQKKYSEQ